MELHLFAFWIIFGILLVCLLTLFCLSIFGVMHKRSLEKKLDKIYMEVRDLNLRVTVVETRIDERVYLATSQIPQIPKKRGRPKKIEEDE